MAMGKSRRRPKQRSMWVATQDLPGTAAHPFYTRLNQILDNADFDGYVESLCQRFYADEVGRPGLPPGRYFRLLLIGYFEGLDAERAIAWRAADSFALREFLGLMLPEAPPDHSTISRTRRLIDLETHEAVFTWILQRLADAGLVKGKTIGIDATTLEANAALRSIVRRATGTTYQEFLTQLAQASGIDTPTREDLARIDRKRQKKGSNDDWTHPLDPDAKITKMKDGRTHLAHKAEQAVDLETGAVVAVTVQGADEGDTTTSIETLIEAAEQVETVAPDGEVKEVVADKGYHSNQVMLDLEAVGVRSYISEPDRGRRNWKDHPEARDAVHRNRRRIRGAHGKRLLRLRGERLERPFAHLYETGRMRRVYLRGHANIRKRVLLHTAALNLGLLMRTLFGAGTPRSLQGRVAALLRALWSLIRLPETVWDAIWTMYRPSTSLSDLLAHREIRQSFSSAETAFTTGCWRLAEQRVRFTISSERTHPRTCVHIRVRDSALCPVRRPRKSVSVRRNHQVLWRVAPYAFSIGACRFGPV
jgi:transposase